MKMELKYIAKFYLKGQEMKVFNYWFIPQIPTLARAGLS